MTHTLPKTAFTLLSLRRRKVLLIRCAKFFRCTLPASSTRLLNYYRARRAIYLAPSPAYVLSTPPQNISLSLSAGSHHRIPTHFLIFRPRGIAVPSTNERPLKLFRFPVPPCRPPGTRRHQHGCLHAPDDPPPRERGQHGQSSSQEPGRGARRGGKPRKISPEAHVHQYQREG